MFESVEQAEDGAGGGIGQRGKIEFAAQDAAEGLDAAFGPGGEIEEGAVFDFAIFAEGFAQENGRRGGAVGDLHNVHDDTI